MLDAITAAEAALRAKLPTAERISVTAEDGVYSVEAAERGLVLGAKAYSPDQLDSAVHFVASFHKTNLARIAPKPGLLSRLFG